MHLSITVRNPLPFLIKTSLVASFFFLIICQSTIDIHTRSSSWAVQDLMQFVITEAPPWSIVEPNRDRVGWHFTPGVSFLSMVVHVNKWAIVTFTQKQGVYSSHQKTTCPQGSPVPKEERDWGQDSHKLVDVQTPQNHAKNSQSSQIKNP